MRVEDKQPFVSLGSKIPFAVNGQVNMDSLSKGAEACMGVDMTKIQPIDLGKSFFVRLLIRMKERHAAHP